MRQIGKIEKEDDARRLADYLLTRRIETRIDPSSRGGFLVWVRREEQVDQARREFDEFVKDPADPKYQGVAQTARLLRRQKEREGRKHARNSIDLRGRWDYRPAERCPLTLGLIGVSVLVSLLSFFGARDDVLSPLFLTSYRVTVVQDSDSTPEGPTYAVRIESEGLSRLRRGEVWRLVTPIFIHFGYWHLLFNMFWLYDLGGLVELRKGTIRLGLLVLGAAIVSNLAEYWLGRVFVPPLNPGQRDQEIVLAGGMSGVVYALFGYVWMKSRYEPESGLALRGNTVFIMLAWLVLGFTGALNPVAGSIANVAHLSGLIVGALFGVIPHWLGLVRR